MPPPPRVSCTPIGAVSGTKSIDRVSRPEVVLDPDRLVVHHARHRPVLDVAGERDRVRAQRATSPDRSQVTEADGRVPEVSTPENQFWCQPSGRSTASPTPAGRIVVPWFMHADAQRQQIALVR